MPSKTFIFYFFRSFLLLLALITFNPHHSYSQGSNIKFKHLSLREGLSQSTVNCMFQDEKGFMWFGTQDGLNRFNGYEFTVYKNTLGDSRTISNGYVNEILQYKDELWIATNKGLNIFNFHNEKFQSIDSSSNGLIDDVITSLHLDKDSNVWIGTNKGLIQYNRDNSMERIPLGKKYRC